MILELDTGQCASKDIGSPRRSGLLDPTFVGEGNKTFLILKLRD